MALITDITARTKVLHVLVEGEFSLEQAKKNFLEIIAALDVYLCEKILIDGRKVSGDPLVVERFYYGEFVAEATKTFKTRCMPTRDPVFAYVLHEPVLDPLRLGETVAVNRGMLMKAFDNMPEALAWLGLTPDDIGEPVNRYERR